VYPKFRTNQFSRPVQSKASRATHQVQRIIRGFDDTELWDLDHTFIRYLVAITPYLPKKPTREIMHLLERIQRGDHLSPQFIQPGFDPDWPQKANRRIWAFYLELALTDSALAIHIADFVSPRLAAFAYSSDRGGPKSLSPCAWRALLLEAAAAFARLPDLSALSGHEKARALEQFEPFLENVCALWS
jgi:hypothetical protein